MKRFNVGTSAPEMTRLYVEVDDSRLSSRRCSITLGWLSGSSSLNAVRRVSWEVAHPAGIREMSARASTTMGYLVWNAPSLTNSESNLDGIVEQGTLDDDPPLGNSRGSRLPGVAPDLQKNSAEVEAAFLVLPEECVPEILDSELQVPPRPRLTRRRRR